MKIFITGADGFIGRALISRLKNTKHLVYGLVRHSKENEKYIKYIRGDLYNPEEFIKDINTSDILIHLAAKKSNWGNTKDFNYLNAKVLTNLITKKSKLSHVIVMSSVYVHGLQKILPITENSSFNAKDDYGKSKILLENVIKKITAKNKLKYTIIRSAIVYGDGDGKIGFMFKLIDLVKKEKFIYIGDGNNHIHLIHINDLIDVFINIIQKQGQNQTYIVAGPDSPTLRQIVDHIKRKLKVNKNFVSLPKFPFYLVANIVENIFRNLSFIKYFSETEPPINKVKLDTLTGDYIYSTLKAKHDFGFSPKIKTEVGINKVLVSSNNNK